MPDTPHTVVAAGEQDLEELLPLMRAYCDFYDTRPLDASLQELARALISDPAMEGVQLIARDGAGVAAGFASVFWSWDTTEGARIGIMNDLFVAPASRGRGVAELLIQACAERCAARGAARLDWQTAPGNARAQAVYDRIGAVREPWLSFSLPVRG